MSLNNDQWHKSQANYKLVLPKNYKIMSNYAIVNAQILIKVPTEYSPEEVEQYGSEWLYELISDNDDVIDYRHPKLMGMYLRPVPVSVKDIDADDVFDDNNIIQV